MKLELNVRATPAICGFCSTPIVPHAGIVEGSFVVETTLERWLIHRAGHARDVTLARLAEGRAIAQANRTKRAASRAENEQRELGAFLDSLPVRTPSLPEWMGRTLRAKRKTSRRLGLIADESTRPFIWTVKGGQ